MYGVTFPDKEKLADYKMRMEEAKKRDHRAQGVKQELFFFDKLSPGSCFFLPNGARIYNLLIDVAPWSSIHFFISTPILPFLLLFPGLKRICKVSWVGISGKVSLLWQDLSPKHYF